MHAADLDTQMPSESAFRPLRVVSESLTISKPLASSLVLRLTLAAMILPHGLQKAFGLFGGFGFTQTMNYFTDTMGIPYLLALLVIVAETLGGVALALGFVTRLAAFGIGAVMFVGALTSHIQYGFFMNWFGNQKGEGIEFHLLALGISLALMISGGGRYAIDNLIAARFLKSRD